jgi:two-component system sensor histidine kinase/response regulator
MEFSNRILIVDDKPLTYEVLRELFASAGYANLAYAADGPSALAQVATDPPDLVLLDVMMSGMDGFEVCRRLKSDPATLHIPVVLFTALTDRNSRLQGLEAGADDFLSKPVDMAELLARTRSLLKAKRLHDELAEAVRARIEFVGQVSHELRTPLFAITGLTEMLLDEEVTEPESIQRYLRTIYEQARHLGRIVDDLLDLSRFERGRQSLKFQSLRLQPFLDDAVALLQPQAAQHGITLRLEETPANLMLRADEGRLRQVIINLLNNALRYNDPDGWVEVGANREGDSVIITVRDNGWGISPTDLPHIFDRFYRGQQTKVNSEQRGAGLGLALAQEIVRAHQGQISVGSEGVPGRGSTFCVRLPVEASEDSDE